MGTCKGVHNSMAAVGVVGTIASMQVSTCGERTPW
jgi:hypothetical protein